MDQESKLSGSALDHDKEVSASPASKPQVTIHCEFAEKLNFACHQSAFAFLRELRIENNDPQEQLSNLRVSLAANPEFMKPKKPWMIERINSGGMISIDDRDIQLDGKLFFDLKEAMKSAVTVCVEKDEVLLAEKTVPVELLAYNEWGGAGYMPELLAAFSMPNDPAVDKILHAAIQILRKKGKPDGIDGYKSKSRERVWEITSAIYAAIANLGIAYAYPPASFERDGQKIRLPSQIIEGGVATCLDTTMLFASVLEQAHLNPVIVMPKEHAMIGVWLQPEELSDVVIDDAEILRKRLAHNELILIETTCVANQPAQLFSQAVKAAEKTIALDKDETFNSAVDIHRARSHRINPLGLATSGGAGQPAELHVPEVQLTLEEAPVLPDFDQGIEEEEIPTTPQGRLERWKRKLLDLTARNPLLNHSSTKTSLQIVCPEPGKLEDKLAEGVRLSIHPSPRKIRRQDDQLHQQRTGEELDKEYARDALDKKQVLVNLPKDELTQRAVGIYRKAQTALQEGGANTLYLGLGFLLWKRNEKDQRRFRAPLILLPVTLERKSVRSGIKLLAHDDEPRFNTTLLEMLHKDFEIDIPGLDQDLPKDQSGVDVAKIWNKVRIAVKEAAGFEVIEDVVLGHFSFAKYLMWKDLSDRTEALRNSALVKHLLDTPRDSYPSDIPFVGKGQVDQEFQPKDLLVPLTADASQLAAIASADRGKDFIIIGPPGTGKSQTISNLIAHMLGKGKTVLFVSEKIAALSVVHRRLQEIGIGSFCLELHSNKANKKDVIKQLGNAWKSQDGTSTSDAWSKEAERVCKLRDKLNSMVHQLHVRRRNGMTAYAAIGRKIRDEQLADRVTLSWASADAHDEQQLDEMRGVVANLKTQVAEVKMLTDNPFQLVPNGDWSPQWEAQITKQAKNLTDAIDKAERACIALCEAIEVTAPERSLSYLEVMTKFAEALIAAHRKQVAYALEVDAQSQFDLLEQAADRLKAYADAIGSLSCTYAPEAWRKLDGNEIIRRRQEAEASWKIKKLWLRYRLIKEMKAGGARGTPDPAVDGPAFAKLREEGVAIDDLDKRLQGFKNWDKHATEPATLVAVRDLGQKMHKAVSQFAADAQIRDDLRSKLKVLLTDNNDQLAADATIGKVAQNFLDANQMLQQSCDSFEELAGKAVRGDFYYNATLASLRTAAKGISERRTELHSWCNWRRCRNMAIDLELKPLVDAIEQGNVPADEISDTFEAAYCAWWSGAVIGDDEVLKTFSTPEHSQTIKNYCAADNKFQKLTAQYIIARLARELPDENDVKRKSSWGILKRETQKKTRHLPVRRLIEEIPDALTTLAPCLMMSPLSVAQYLPTTQELFDVVIFDEASQIPVWDAVGSLARGKQVIIAGDNKQMPPTNFFNRADDDQDGDIDVEGDLESILDEMLSASIPQLTLNMHYRSRKESLIAFSNEHYYDNELITFPASVHPDRGVKLIEPEGFYARGQARHNQGEAKAIVEEIVRRLTHDDPEVRTQSIGVVTFNTEQQSLIENLLDVARNKQPEIEWAFAAEPSDGYEPVFVKNLETVQGDERDIILFSVTYGPDQSDHVTMNFGPLNRDGGERRLNVALTRSRSEMLAFSTLQPDHINLSKTQASAVKDLKNFLKYAKSGSAAFKSMSRGPLADFDSPFEAAVARELRKLGYEVHPQVGVSKYRIDLGIVHADKPGRYLAGVECDGAMYHSSAVARERDKIRQQVLEGLGWTLCRVWSTDWWVNRNGALTKLHESLQKFLQADRAKQAKQVSQASVQASVQASAPSS